MNAVPGIMAKPRNRPMGTVKVRFENLSSQGGHGLVFEIA